MVTWSTGLITLPSGTVPSPTPGETLASVNPSILLGFLGSTAAAVVGILTVVASIIIATRHDRTARREQWWARLTWAAEKAVSGKGREPELGLEVLLHLLDDAEATPQDNAMALAVAAIIMENVEKKPGRRRWRR